MHASNATKIHTGGGDIIMRGRGSGYWNNSHGVSIYGGLIDAGDGTISIDGIGRTSSNHGVLLNGASSAKLYLYAAGGSNNTSSPAISISGEVQHNGSSQAIYTGLNAQLHTDIVLEARGQGGISLYASRTTGTSVAMALNGTALLSQNGPIDLRTSANNDGIFFYYNGSYGPGAMLGAAPATTVDEQSYAPSNATVGTTIRTSSADITIETDRIYSASNNRMILHTTGDVSIMPISNEFRSMPFVYSRMYGIGTLDIAKDNAPAQPTRFYGEAYGQGPFNIRGGYIQIYGTLRTLADGADIELKASRELYLHDWSRGGLFTNNGDIILRSNNNNNDAEHSFIYVADGVQLVSAMAPDIAILQVDNISQAQLQTLIPGYRTATGGGNIVMASGSANDDIGPYGFARTRTSSNPGVRFGTSGTSGIMYSGGGDIRMYGGSHVNSVTGLLVQGHKTIAAGAGQIDIQASTPVASSRARGIEIGANQASRIAILSSATASPAINIEAVIADRSEEAILIGFHAYTWRTGGQDRRILIEASGQGGINIDGTKVGTGGFLGVEINGTAILSKEGDITIDGNQRGVRFSGRYSNLGHVALGSCVTNDLPNFGLSLCDGSDVQNSTADIKVVGDQVIHYGFNNVLTIRTTGDVVMEPQGQNFTTTFNHYATYGKVVPANIRFGKDSTTASAELYTRPNLVADGSIELYGSNIYIDGDLKSLAMNTPTASAGIRAKASGSIFTDYVANSDTLRSNILTNGSSIVLWSNAGTNVGSIIIQDGTRICSATNFAAVSQGDAAFTSCNSTGGGDIHIAGGTSVASSDSSVLNATVPGGFAEGFGTYNYSGHVGSQTTGNGYLSGVHIGLRQQWINTTSIHSGGGDIVIRGQTTNNSSYPGSWYSLAYGVVAMGDSNTTNGTSGIFADGGKVLIHGECASPTNNVTCGGVGLNMYASNQVSVTSII